MAERLREYNVVRLIGKGSYGEVFLVRARREKKQFVMKNIRLASSKRKERDAAEQEASLLSQLNHPNIVSYRESFQDNDGVLHIVMGYCDGGDLCSRLKRCNGQLLPEVQIVEWFVQISLALQYLHERNILHRDLKTQNIFLSKSNIVKVGDLGIARVLDASTELAHTVIGTPYYMSPEQFAGSPYNHKSDIWALGCCLYEMASLRHAFTASNITSLMYRILHGEVPPLPEHEYSDDLSSLVQSMLSRDAAQRPSVHQILRLAYIKRHIRVFLDRERSKGRKSAATAGGGGVAKPAPSSPAVPVDLASQQQGSLSSARERRRRTRQHDSPSIGARIVLRSRSNEKLPSPQAVPVEQDQEVISLLNNTLQLPDHSPPLTHHHDGADTSSHDHTMRLRERNKYLRQELVSMLGESQLDAAMAILADTDHDQHEDKLKQIIGQDASQQCIGQLRELQLYNYLF